MNLHEENGYTEVVCCKDLNPGQFFPTTIGIFLHCLIAGICWKVLLSEQ